MRISSPDIQLQRLLDMVVLWAERASRQVARHQRLRRLFSILAILMVSTLSMGCHGSTRPLVKIGMIAPFEELYREDGYAALHAAKLAVAERNASGGVAGHDVALVALNDSGQPGEAALQAAKLGIDPLVAGIVGPLNLATARAAGPVLADHDLPWISPVPLEPREVPGGYSLSASPADMAAVAVRALLSASPDSSAPLIVFSDQPTAASAAIASATGAEADVVVLADQATALDAAANAGGLAWFGDAALGALLAQSLQGENGFEGSNRQGETGSAQEDFADLPVPMIGGPELGSPVFYRRSGVQAPWLSSGPRVNELPEDFVAAYAELAGAPPGPQAVLVYDATNLLLDALDRAGRQGLVNDRVAVARALREVGSEGWSGLAGMVRWSSAGCELEDRVREADANARARAHSPSTLPVGCQYWEGAPIHQHGQRVQSGRG